MNWESLYCISASVISASGSMCVPVVSSLCFLHSFHMLIQNFLSCFVFFGMALLHALYFSITFGRSKAASVRCRQTLVGGACNCVDRCGLWIGRVGGRGVVLSIRGVFEVVTHHQEQRVYLWLVFRPIRPLHE